MRFRFPINRFPHSLNVAATLATCAAVILVGWALAFERVAYEREQAVAGAYRETANLALAFEQDVVRTLEALDLAMRVTQHEFTEKGAKVDLRAVFSALNLDQGPFTTLSVVDERGNVVASTGSLGIDLSDRDYFRFHKSNPSSHLHVSAPLNGRVSGRPSIPVSRRFDKLDGTFGGIVLAGVTPSYFTDFFRMVDLGTGGLIQIVGVDGIVRARRSGTTTNWGGDLSRSNLIDRVREAAVGSFPSVGRIDGVPRFMSYRRVAGADLLVVVGVPVVEALAPAHARGRHYYGVAAAATLLVVLFGAVLVVALRRHGRALEEKRWADETYRQTFDRAPIGIVHQDMEGRYTKVNEAFCAMLGYTEAELLGRSFLEILHPEDAAAARATMREHEEGKPWPSIMKVENRHLRKDGSTMAGAASLSFIEARTGMPGYMLVMIEDVTQRKRTELALAESEARFRDLVNNTNDFIWELDDQFRFAFASDSLKSLLGAGPDHVLGRRPVEFMPLADRARVAAEFESIVMARRSFSGMEHTVLDVEGRPHVWEVSGVPILNAAGGLAGYRGVSRDITERKAAQAALQEREEAAQRALARSRAHLDALEKVASSPEFAASDIEGLARCITEAVARATGAACANLWLFEKGGKELRCIDLYEAPAGRHGAGMILHEAQFANEFAALKQTSYVNADEPLSDPRTAGYVESYLKPLGITSMLDAVVRVSGRNLGLLRIEHVGRPHHWEEDEIVFGCRLADKFATALARREAIAHQERFRRYFEIGLIGMAIADPRRGIIEANPRLAEMLGYTRDALIGMDWAALTHPEDLGADLQQMERLGRGEIESYRTEKRFLRKDGRVLCANIEVRCVRKPDGTPDYFFGMIEDLTERKRAQDRIAATFHQAGVGIVTASPDTLLLEVNERFASMLGYRPEELVGRTIIEITHTDDRQRSTAFHDHLISDGGYSDEMEKRLVAKDGRPVWVVVTAACVRDSNGGPDYFVAVVRDITERKRIQEKLDYQSHYDALTTLPNRVLFMDRLEQTLHQGRRKQWTTGVLVVDLDRFKAVNDSYGQTAGDELLREAARRLQGSIRPGDTVARLSSDEFAVVLADLARPEDAGAVATKVLAALTVPFLVQSRDVFVSASVGVATHPPGGSDPEGLVRDASAAMHKAKEAGRGNVQFYSEGMQRAASERVELEADLRRAIERRELLLHFQPKLSLITGRISGFEALMRWMHPVRGLVPPGRFIPVMEETGLIVQAGEWAVDAVCAQLAAWRNAGMPAVPVAVNLSARQFLHRNVHAVIEAALARHRVDPALLEIEVTESDAMRNPQEVAAILGRLRERGHTIAVDDFGTGYSSLAYLKRLPLDTLKIDRSFITGLPSDLDDASIARAVIAMAHRLGLKVVAEGVETEEQKIFLTINKCDEMQGFLFSRPLPPEACLKLLATAQTPAVPA